MGVDIHVGGWYMSISLGSLVLLALLTLVLMGVALVGAELLYRRLTSSKQNRAAPLGLI